MFNDDRLVFYGNPDNENDDDNYLLVEKAVNDCENNLLMIEQKIITDDEITVFDIYITTDEVFKLAGFALKLIREGLIK